MVILSQTSFMILIQVGLYLTDIYGSDDTGPECGSDTGKNCSRWYYCSDAVSTRTWGCVPCVRPLSEEHGCHGSHKHRECEDPVPCGGTPNRYFETVSCPDLCPRVLVDGCTSYELGNICHIQCVSHNKTTYVTCKWNYDSRTAFWDGDLQSCVKECDNYKITQSSQKSEEAPYQHNLTFTTDLGPAGVKDDGNGISFGEIGGIVGVIAGLIVILMVIVLIALFIRKFIRLRQKKAHRGENPQANGYVAVENGAVPGRNAHALVSMVNEPENRNSTTTTTNIPSSDSSFLCTATEHSCELSSVVTNQTSLQPLIESSFEVSPDEAPTHHLCVQYPVGVRYAHLDSTSMDEEESVAAGFKPSQGGQNAMSVEDSKRTTCTPKRPSRNHDDPDRHDPDDSWRAGAGWRSPNVQRDNIESFTDEEETFRKSGGHGVQDNATGSPTMPTAHGDDTSRKLLIDGSSCPGEARSHFQRLSANTAQRDIWVLREGSDASQLPSLSGQASGVRYVVNATDSNSADNNNNSSHGKDSGHLETAERDTQLRGGINDPTETNDETPCSRSGSHTGETDGFCDIGEIESTSARNAGCETTQPKYHLPQSTEHSVLRSPEHSDPVEHSERI